MVITKPTQDKVLQQLLQLVRQRKLPVERVILHGSHAKGTATAKSDYDLLVVTSSKVSANERMDASGFLMFEMGKRLLWPIDVVITNDEEINQKKFPLLISAIHQGKTIYTGDDKTIYTGIKKIKHGKSY